MDEIAREAERVAVETHGDVALADKIRALREALAKAVKRADDLEMRFVNEKRSPFEDPLAVHALHFSKT